MSKDNVVELDDVKHIGHIVDMPVVKYINYLQNKSFVVVNAIGRQLETALAQVQQMRVTLERVRGEMKGEDVEKSFNQFITTFVVEKDITTKMDILKSIRKIKGIKLPEID